MNADFAMKEFVAHRALRNPHAMTIAAVFWRRGCPLLPASQTRLFETEPGTQVRAECHWQKDAQSRATLVVLHGLEGSSESGYIMGTAERAWLAGFNVVRLNQRNCGGTERLTPTIYHSGMSGDIRAVISELIALGGMAGIFAVGFSMGGNLVLKMAGEWGSEAPHELRGVVAIAPALDLEACAQALEAPQNFLYERHFVMRLKERIARKARIFPEVYSGIKGLAGVRTVREYDDVVTAPLAGFRDASDYYARSSAGPLLGRIARPTMILTAEDDPIVPIASIRRAIPERNGRVRLLSTRHGGHCAFISASGEERFWSEGRVVDFCVEVSAGAESL